MNERSSGMLAESFEDFCAPVLNSPVSHVWRGHGSALFLEIGALTPCVRRDGSAGNPVGEFELMIEGGWRLEDKFTILGCSWSDEKDWAGLFERLGGANVTTITLFARLPEVQVGFSNGLYLCSFMTIDGDPDWALCDRRGDQIRFVEVRSGSLCFGSEVKTRR